MIKVLIVDDNALDRDGLKYSLIDEPDLEIVGEAGNGNEAVEMAGELKPDVVLMDLRMPIMSGVDATKKIVEMEPAPRVIALSSYETDRYVGPAMEAGAAAHIRKDAPSKDLLRLVRGPQGKTPAREAKGSDGGRTALPSVQKRERSPEMLERMKRRASYGNAPRPGSDMFSDIELDVLTHAARGMTNAQIATRLGIDEPEIRRHLLHIYRTLGVRDRSGMLWKARRLKILT